MGELYAHVWVVILLDMDYLNDIVICGPLEGVLVCLCRTFPGERFSMEGLGHLDLHRGLNPTGWMMCPHSFHTCEDERFLWMDLENMWWWSCGPWNLSVVLMRPRMSYPSPWCQLGWLDFDGVWWFQKRDDVVWRMKIHNTILQRMRDGHMAFGGPTTCV